jgi:predicted RNA-binding protein with TRAM domain
LARVPRGNIKVEILTLLYNTERPNLEDSSSYGEGSDSHSSGGGGYRGGFGGGRGGVGGRFGGPRPFRPSPVRVGEEYDVKIESMSKRGDSGVARVQGLVIFVTGTNVGDSVRIRVTKVGRGYATAEVVGGGEGAAGGQQQAQQEEAPMSDDAGSEDTDVGDDESWESDGDKT